MEVKLSSSFQELDGTGEAPARGVRPSSSFSRPALAGPSKPVAPPPLPKDVAVEKYSGLRLRSEPGPDRSVSQVFVSASVESVRLSRRKPLVSSCEMDRKMADRRLIRLSQVPERLTREKLEDSDWVTFAVLVNKVTPQSSSSVRTPHPEVQCFTSSGGPRVFSQFFSPPAGKNFQHLETQRPPQPGRVRVALPVRRRPQAALEEGPGDGGRTPQPEPHEAEGRERRGESLLRGPTELRSNRNRTCWLENIHFLKCL